MNFLFELGIRTFVTSLEIRLSISISQEIIIFIFKFVAFIVMSIFYLITFVFADQLPQSKDFKLLL